MHSLTVLGFNATTNTVKDLMLTVTRTKHLQTLYIAWTCFTHDGPKEWLPKLDAFLFKKDVASLGLEFNCFGIHLSEIEERLSKSTYRSFEQWFAGLFPLMSLASKVTQIPMIAV